jgi:hypothetical protein
VLEAGVRQTLDDFSAVKVMIQKPRYVNMLHNFSKITKVESNKWSTNISSYACT